MVQILLEKVIVKEVKKVQSEMNVIQHFLSSQKNRNPFKRQSLNAVIKRLTKAWFLKFLKVPMVQKELREDLAKIVDSEVQGHLRTAYKESFHLTKNQLNLLRPLKSLLLQRLIST